MHLMLYDAMCNVYLNRCIWREIYNNDVRGTKEFQKKKFLKTVLNESIDTR